MCVWESIHFFVFYSEQWKVYIIIIFFLLPNHMKAPFLMFDRILSFSPTACLFFYFCL